MRKMEDLYFEVQDFQDFETEVEQYKDKMPADIKANFVDVGILYAEEDRIEAEQFRQHLINEIRLESNGPVRAVLYDGLEMTSLAEGKISQLDAVLRRSTYTFFFLTKNFVNDTWMTVVSESCLLDSIYSPEKKWCIVPVYTEKRSCSQSFKIPLRLNSLKGINYYNNDEFYRKGVARLISDKVHVQVQSEENLKIKQKEWIENHKRERLMFLEKQKRVQMTEEAKTEYLKGWFQSEIERLVRKGMISRSLNKGTVSHVKSLDTKVCSSSSSTQSMKAESPHVANYFQQLLTQSSMQRQSSYTEDQLSILKQVYKQLKDTEMDTDAMNSRQPRVDLMTNDERTTNQFQEDFVCLRSSVNGKEGDPDIFHSVSQTLKGDKKDEETRQMVEEKTTPSTQNEYIDINVTYKSNVQIYDNEGLSPASQTDTKTYAANQSSDMSSPALGELKVSILNKDELIADNVCLSTKVDQNVEHSCNIESVEIQGSIFVGHTMFPDQDTQYTNGMIEKIPQKKMKVEMQGKNIREEIQLKKRREEKQWKKKWKEIQWKKRWEERQWKKRREEMQWKQRWEKIRQKKRREEIEQQKRWEKIRWKKRLKKIQLKEMGEETQWKKRWEDIQLKRRREEMQRKKRWEEIRWKKRWEEIRRKKRWEEIQLKERREEIRWKKRWEKIQLNKMGEEINAIDTLNSVGLGLREEIERPVFKTMHFHHRMIYERLLSPDPFLELRQPYWEKVVNQHRYRKSSLPDVQGTDKIYLEGPVHLKQNGYTRINCVENSADRHGPPLNPDDTIPPTVTEEVLDVSAITFDRNVQSKELTKELSEKPSVLSLLTRGFEHSVSYTKNFVKDIISYLEAYVQKDFRDIYQEEGDSYHIKGDRKSPDEEFNFRRGSQSYDKTGSRKVGSSVQVSLIVMLLVVLLGGVSATTCEDCHTCITVRKEDIMKVSCQTYCQPHCPKDFVGLAVVKNAKIALNGSLMYIYALNASRCGWISEIFHKNSMENGGGKAAGLTRERVRTISRERVNQKTTIQQFKNCLSVENLAVVIFILVVAMVLWCDDSRFVSENNLDMLLGRSRRKKSSVGTFDVNGPLRTSDCQSTPSKNVSLNGVDRLVFRPHSSIVTNNRAMENQYTKPVGGILDDKLDMSQVDVRQSTFDKMPEDLNLKLSIPDMARAGVVYAGVSNAVRCFSCGGCLSVWKEGDSPVVQHVRMNPQCRNFRQMYGQEYIDHQLNTRCSWFPIMSHVIDFGYHSSWILGSSASSFIVDQFDVPEPTSWSPETFNLNIKICGNVSSHLIKFLLKCRDQESICHRQNLRSLTRSQVELKSESLSRISNQNGEILKLSDLQYLQNKHPTFYVDFYLNALFFPFVSYSTLSFNSVVIVKLTKEKADKLEQCRIGPEDMTTVDEYHVAKYFEQKEDKEETVITDVVSKRSSVASKVEAFWTEEQVEPTSSLAEFKDVVAIRQGYMNQHSDGVINLDEKVRIILPPKVFIADACDSETGKFTDGDEQAEDDMVLYQLSEKLAKLERSLNGEPSISGEEQAENGMVTYQVPERLATVDIDNDHTVSKEDKDTDSSADIDPQAIVTERLAKRNQAKHILKRDASVKKGKQDKSTLSATVKAENVIDRRSFDIPESVTPSLHNHNPENRARNPFYREVVDLETKQKKRKKRYNSEDSEDAAEKSANGKDHVLAIRHLTWLTSDQLPVPKVDIQIYRVFDPLDSIFKKMAQDETPGPEITMQYELLRLCTLRNYPKENKPFIIRLAGAGFYYAADGDEVICYCCGLRRHGWEETDVPFDIHRRISANCNFLTKNAEVNVPVPRAAGQERNRFAFLEEPEGTIPSRDTSEDVSNECSFAGMPNSSTQQQRRPGNFVRDTGEVQVVTTSSRRMDETLDLDLHQRENEVLRDRVTCSRCSDQEFNTLFLPCCCHFLCEECSNGEEICPLCGIEITAKFKTYRS